MGKPTGFLEIKRELPADRTSVDRLRDWKEFHLHLPLEKHDFGINKRIAVYEFMAKQLQLNRQAIFDTNGIPNESGITIEKEELLHVFGDHGEQLPANAIRGFAQLEQVWNTIPHQ